MGNYLFKNDAYVTIQHQELYAKTHHIHNERQPHWNEVLTLYTRWVFGCLGLEGSRVEREVLRDMRGWHWIPGDVNLRCSFDTEIENFKLRRRQDRALH